MAADAAAGRHQARERLSSALQLTAILLPVACLVGAAAFLAGAGDAHPGPAGYSAIVTPRPRRYRLVAAGLLLETTVFKLEVWRDVRSWALELALGLCFTAAALRVR